MLILQKGNNMNKRQIIASLKNIANELDATGLYTEANSITKVMIRIADEDESKKDESELERAIEKFKLECKAISNSKRTLQEKMLERRFALMEIMALLKGEDKVKFDRATHKISVD